MKKLLLSISLFIIGSLLSMVNNLSGQNYPPVLDKSTLKGVKGITIPSVGSGTSNNYGVDIQFIGDINNDGLEDVVISSDYTLIDGNDFTGKAFVVFGTEDTFNSEFDLNSLDGENGFIVEGVEEGERRGGANAGVGDINGDGIDDVVIGSTSSNKDMIVIYGRTSFPAVLKSSDINGSNGFRIEFSGSYSVDDLGDVNGDGISDFIIGTPHWSGHARIVFGRSDNFPNGIDESYLDGENGFSTSEFPASRASYKVGGAGDINNDGINDIMIGSWNTHSGGPDDEKISYALFGKSEAFDPLVEITEVDGSDGFLIDNRGNASITYVGEVGDVNGDGIDDCFSENNLIFGTDDPFPASMMMANFDGENGFVFKDYILCAAPAGDLNFDGIDDFIIANDNYNIVYGTTDGFPAEFDYESVDGDNGFIIDDIDNSNSGRSIDGGRDFNGDGKSDFIFSDRSTKKVYIVFGGDHYAIPFHDDYPKLADITKEGFSLLVNAQEKGSAYYAVFESSTSYTTDYETIKSGNEAVLNGDFSIDTKDSEITEVLNQLNSSTEYDIHLYFEDETGNKSAIYSIEDIKTLFDQETAFVTTWNTENEGDSNDDQIKLTAGIGYYDIYWEKISDPTVNNLLENQAGTTTVTFPEPGIYKVFLPKNISRFFFNSYNNDSKKLLTVEKWGEVQWQSMEDMFYDCSNLTIPADDVPDMSQVSSMSYMFYKASSFNSDINDWDVSNVTDFDHLFFAASSFNQDLNNWDVSNVTSMRSAFYLANSFNSDISNWDVSKVTDMYFMFSDATSFNQDIGSWDVSEVTKMGCLFRNTPFNQDIGNWDVGNVTAMNEMFRKATDFNQDISNWDVSQNTSMYFMFSEASNFNQDIGGWDVSNVENMNYTFRDSPAFDQDLGDWDVSKVNSFFMFLRGSGLSPCNYSATLEGWSKLSLQDGLSFYGGDSQYTSEAAVYRQTIIDDFNWAISDNGELSDEVAISITQEVSCPSGSDAILVGESSIDEVGFKWYNEEDEIIGEEAVLEGLEAGTYTLKVVVAADCFFTKEITINDGTDTQAPELSCPEDQELIPGENIPDYTSLAVISDNCDSEVAVTQSPAAGTSFTEETTITLTAEDASGNTKTCTFVVEVTPDTEAPELSCPAKQTLACDATELPDYTDLASATDDRDTDPSISQSPAPGSPFIAGMTITITAKDAAGNEATCDFIVDYEEDTESPAIECPDVQELIPGENIPDYTSLVEVSDNCDSEISVTQSPAVGTPFTEETTVTLTAEDASGNTNSCTFIIEVIPDTEAPEITCPNNQNIACDVNVIPDYTSLVSVSDDRDSSPVITQSPAAGSEFVEGMTITISAEDTYGNSASCDFKVSSEVDVTSPSITCMEDQTLIIGEKLPDYTSMVVVSDDCDAHPEITQSVPAGSEVSGDLTISIIAEDENGNTENCEFKVTATSEPDTTAPDINCINEQVLACDATEIPDYTDLVSATDNRDPNPTISQSPAVGSPFVDEMTITITAEDNSGNSSFCEFSLSSEDTESPEISCIETQILEEGQLLPDYTELVSVSDNCDSSPKITQTPEEGVEVMENLEILITAEDENGNSTTCRFQVEVNSIPDTEAPEITCPDTQTVSCGTDEIPDFRDLASAIDNKDSNPTVTQSPLAGSVFTEGMEITLTAEDQAGNSSSCTFEILLETNNPISISCPENESVSISENCSAIVPDFSGLVNTEDNCTEIETINQTPDVGTAIFEDTEMHLEVIDKEGNQSSCSFVLNIDGESSPKVDVQGEFEISKGESVELNAEGSSEGDYQWFPSLGLDNPNIAKPVAKPDKTTTYRVIFTNNFGCSVEAEVIVYVNDGIQVAKGFSPDNDGINDTWIIKGIEEYENNEVVIYNRWGNIVFAIEGYDNQNNVFEGIANRNTKIGGGNLPEGTYFYRIGFGKGHSDLEGFIVLKK